MTRTLVASAVAVVLGSGLAVQARASAQQPAPSTPPAGTMVHFEGCLFTETALTANPPILTAPIGNQTYVLTAAKLIAGAIPEDEVAKTVYALDKVEQGDLRALYGKRVGVTGRVTQTPTRPRIDVVDLREISGGCPAIPSSTT